MEDFIEIFNQFREICNKEYSLPEQVFTDASLGIYDDENIDVRCFSMCLAQLGGILKKSGDPNVDQMKKVTEKFDLSEKQLTEFMTGINACKNVCKFLFLFIIN